MPKNVCQLFATIFSSRDQNHDIRLMPVQAQKIFWTNLSKATDSFSTIKVSIIFQPKWKKKLQPEVLTKNKP